MPGRLVRAFTHKCRARAPRRRLRPARAPRPWFRHRARPRNSRGRPVCGTAGRRSGRDGATGSHRTEVPAAIVLCMKRLVLVIATLAALGLAASAQASSKLDHAQATAPVRANYTSFYPSVSAYMLSYSGTLQVRGSASMPSDPGGPVTVISHPPAASRPGPHGAKPGRSPFHPRPVWGPTLPTHGWFGWFAPSPNSS
jgi:hypothetical protein